MAPADPKALQAKYQPKQSKVLPNTQQLCMIRFSPDGKILAGGSFENVVRRWDFTSGTYAELPELKGHNGWVQSILFHTDGKRLFSADSWGQICAWPFAEKEPKPLWSVKDAHDGWIHGLALSPDGKTIASCGRDQTIRLSSCDDGKKVTVLKNPEDVLAIAFHPDGKSLVSGDLKGIIRQWDLASGKAVRGLDAKMTFMLDRIQDVGGIRCFAFDTTGSLLCAGGTIPKTGGFVEGKNVILTFDWQTGKVKHTLRGTADNEGFVTDMAWHADGFLMAVSSGQPGVGKLIFHRVEDATPFVTMPLPNCHSLALQPDEARLVVSATNGGSNGNGRLLKNKEYPGNFSPLHILEFPKPKS